MHITILGRSEPESVADRLAYMFGQTLSALGHKLSVGGSPTGVSEEVRKGAAQAPCRHVRTYYVRTINPIIMEDRSYKNGYFFLDQQSVIDRFGLISSASAVIILGLSRANIGTALNLLYEQRASTRSNIDSHIAPRLLLFHQNVIPCRASNELCHNFGNLVDEEDISSLTTFSSTHEALASIGVWADRPKHFA